MGARAGGAPPPLAEDAGGVDGEELKVLSDQVELNNQDIRLPTEDRLEVGEVEVEVEEVVEGTDFFVIPGACDSAVCGGAGDGGREVGEGLDGRRDMMSCAR